MEEIKTLLVEPSTVSFFNYVGTEIENLIFPSAKRKLEATAFWQRGKHYIIKNVNCDGFTNNNNTKTEYVLKTTIKEHAGVELNCVIVKKINDGNATMSYTLSKNDCEIFGIEYEPHLEILPDSLPWEQVMLTNGEFNPNDFSTVTLNQKNGLITCFVVKIEGVELSKYNGQLYIKQFDSLVSSSLYDNFIITSKDVIRDAEDNFNLWRKDECVKYTYTLCDGDLYCIIHTYDPYGIDPQQVTGLRATDVFDFHFRENSLVKVEEYERRIESYSNYRQRNNFDHIQTIPVISSLLNLYI